MFVSFSPILLIIKLKKHKIIKFHHQFVRLWVSSICMIIWKQHSSEIQNFAYFYAEWYKFCCRYTTSRASSQQKIWIVCYLLFLLPTEKKVIPQINKGFNQFQYATSSLRLCYSVTHLHFPTKIFLAFNLNINNSRHIIFGTEWRVDDYYGLLLRGCREYCITFCE